MAIFTASTKHLGGTEKETPKLQFFYGLVQKNVLVTGADGQLGSEIKAMTGRMNLPFHFIFTDVGGVDITDIQQVESYVRNYRIEYIVNCAAYTAVDKAENDVEKAFEVNAVAVGNIARVAKKEGVKVIQISTDYVFDGSSDVPYTEDMKPNPLSVYGKSKLAGEEELKAAGGDWAIIRTSWMYSSFGNNFVKSMIRLMRERKSLTIVDDQRGAPTYAADLAEMIIHILQSSEENGWKSGIYHFSNRGDTTWYGFASEIKRLAGIESCELSPVTSEEYGSPVQRPAYSVMSLSKICAAFNVEIPEWKESLKRCFMLLK